MRQEFAHAIVFTGHRIDAPGRAQPRFPASAEAAVRAAIRAALAEVLVGLEPDHVVGVAGGASGGDLLFHEVSAELGVETRLVLALPEEAFVAASVADGGEAWVLRFRTLVARLGDGAVSVIAQAETNDDGVWVGANRAMIELAVELAPQRTLVALWDGEPGDGPGGTAAMVAMARECGVGRVVRIPLPLFSVAGL